MSERGSGAPCESGGFGLGFGGRGRGGDCGCGAGHRDDEEKWVPVTKLGRLVKDGKISLQQISLHSLPIKISKYQIIEITENVCNLKKAEAYWILLIDIVEQGDKLQAAGRTRI